MVTQMFKPSELKLMAAGYVKNIDPTRIFSMKAESWTDEERKHEVLITRDPDSGKVYVISQETPTEAALRDSPVSGSIGLTLEEMGLFTERARAFAQENA